MPSLGSSSPPRRCSSVLLPEPEAPTMATISPARTARSTPSSTTSAESPSPNTRRSPEQASTASLPAAGASLIAQGFRRPDARGPPARIDRRRERHQARGDTDDDDIARMEVARQVVDEIDALRQHLEPERPLDRAHERSDVERAQHAERHAGKRAQDTDRGALGDEDAHDAGGAGPERAQD